MSRIVLLIVGMLFISACSPAADVTNVGGDPVRSDEPTAPQPTATAGQIVGAPSCKDLPVAASGLDCLGEGGPVALADLPGPVVVPIWASWCVPCRAELPVLEQVSQDGVAVVGIVAADNATAAAELAEDLGLTFPSLLDPQSQTKGSLGWVGLPATFVLQDGEVVHRFSAPVSSPQEVTQVLTEFKDE